MELKNAERWLKNHFHVDTLDADQVRGIAELFERVMGDPERYPRADLETIDAYLDAAYSWLGGLNHQFKVEA